MRVKHLSAYGNGNHYVKRYGCLTKENCHLKSSKMARSLFNILRDR